MNTDNILSQIHDQPLWLAAPAAVALLLAAAWLLRRKARPKLATRVTTAATLLGLGWSAQGMLDNAIRHYKQDAVVASVLFVVFEAMLAARMLKAHQYRTDLRRRAKHVAAVWVIASVMAVVVALGEGLVQAPARLSIPLLVAYGWYTDLTADDDPDEKLKTSWRLTPRRIGLAIGLLEPGKRDVEEINHDRLRDRMTRLAFRQHHGDPRLNDFLRRNVRLQRLQTLADDDDVAEVRRRLARSRVDLMTTEPVPVPKQAPASERIHVPDVPRRRIPELGKTGVHVREGRAMRGAELKADAVQLVIDSVSPKQPLGMTTAELQAKYEPQLGVRTAEGHAAEARKILRNKINGAAVNAS